MDLLRWWGFLAGWGLAWDRVTRGCPGLRPLDAGHAEADPGYRGGIQDRPNRLGCVNRADPAWDADATASLTMIAPPLLAVPRLTYVINAFAASEDVGFAGCVGW
jgi:hypothetical protein